MSPLLEKILSQDNIEMALNKVCQNKGAAGSDNLSVKDIKEYFSLHWKDIDSQIKDGTYKPVPIKRIKIPKSDGKERMIGIPSVIDRVIQQSIVEVISPICEPYFSPYSYGFRVNHSAHQAMNQLLEYINEGYSWVIDFDIERFFDSLPQDKLMSEVHKLINDGEVESLIRKYLKVGIMEEEKVSRNEGGVIQGGNLSPLLANIMLNKLDNELMKRGLRFIRYADDFVVLVKSKASATRVMYSMTSFIERKLSMKVNASKTKIQRPDNLKFLGFSCWFDKQTNKWRLRPHKESVMKLKRKIKALTKRNSPIELTKRIEALNYLIRGWINYFALGDMKGEITRIDSHLRTRIRIIIWKQWKTPKKRQWGLQKLHVNKDLARLTAYSGGRRYYWTALRTCLVRAISKEILKHKGLESCLDYYLVRHEALLSC